MEGFKTFEMPLIRGPKRQSIYPNIRAEQARRGWTNQQVADHLGMCRKTYENKMAQGGFTVEEAQRLMKLFKKSFSHLFATDSQI